MACEHEKNGVHINILWQFQACHQLAETSASQKTVHDAEILIRTLLNKQESSSSSSTPSLCIFDNTNLGIEF